MFGIATLSGLSEPQIVAILSPENAYYTWLGLGAIPGYQPTLEEMIRHWRRNHLPQPTIFFVSASADDTTTVQQ